MSGQIALSYHCVDYKSTAIGKLATAGDYKEVQWMALFKIAL